jgi:GGDEF domain-containing protein
MKHTKTIIFLLFFIFLVILVNSFFVIYLVQNNQIKNAYIINELGQIRGGTQRYCKLALIGKDKEKIDSVKRYIDNKYSDIENIYKDIIPYEAMDFFKKNFYSLKNNWEKIKKTQNKNKLYVLSEKSWETADPLVIYIAKAMENKTQKILFFIILLSIISVLSTLVTIYIIYSVISKSLNIKTLKNPISKLYNLYHLEESLNILQNRYQRYGKNFALLKIISENIPSEKIIKELSQILKNNIRRSDKIYHYQNKIVIIFIEPEKMDLNKTQKRIIQLIQKKLENIKAEIIIYSGEDIKSFI